MSKLTLFIVLGPVPDYCLIWDQSHYLQTSPTNLGPVMLDHVH